MGDQGRWFKLWVGWDADPDMANLSLENQARWCRFGTYLKQHGHRGHLKVVTPAKALQELFRVDSFNAVLAVLSAFPNCRVTDVTNSPVTLEVTWLNWHKYQGDYSGDRVREWRQQQRQSGNAIKKRGEETRRDSPLRSSSPDSVFFEKLRKNPAYKGIDIDRELSRMDGWLSTPAGTGRKKTKRFIVNWLNRIDVPLLAGKSQAQRLWDEAQREKESGP